MFYTTPSWTVFTAQIVSWLSCVGLRDYYKVKFLYVLELEMK